MSAPTENPFDAALDHRLHTSLGALRSACPVARVRSATGCPTWLVLGDAQVRAGLLDPRLSVQGAQKPSRAGQRRAMDIGLTRYDGDMHARVRALSRVALAAPTVRGYGGRFAGMATELLAGLPRDRTVDLMAEFARPFAFAALTEVFGVPAEVRPALLTAFLEILDRTPDSAKRLHSNVDLVEAVVRRELAARAAHPGNDTLSALRAAWDGDGRLPEDELVSLAGMLLLGGFDTTAQSLGLSVVALLDRPALLRGVRERPQRWPRVLEELLRWDTPGPFSTPRQALSDVELGGVTIPRGSRVMFAFAAANRDPTVYDRPDELDPDRPRTARHLTFGLGPHTCPGAALARTELIAALGALVGTAPGLRLAVPRESLVWAGRPVHRRLAALPVALG